MDTLNNTRKIAGCKALSLDFLGWIILDNILKYKIL